MTDRATVSPPNPESKMPIGASALVGVGVGTGSRLGAGRLAGHAIGSVGPVTLPERVIVDQCCIDLE